MISALIKWSLDNPFIVLCGSLALVIIGVYSFQNINVEAYPDPAPAVIELVAQWPGASAEEMERLVTVPLEVTMAGMPKLKTVHSRSLFGLTHLRCIFHYDFSYEQARQEVINRLGTMNQPLPPGVTPQISPANPIGEIYRYTLKSPKNALGQDIYTLNDLKALQDWLVEREFRKVPRIIDVTSFGGTVKRYEVQPDPDKLKAKGITLNQLASALASSNANVGGDFHDYRAHRPDDPLPRLHRRRLRPDDQGDGHEDTGGSIGLSARRGTGTARPDSRHRHRRGQQRADPGGRRRLEGPVAPYRGPHSSRA